MSVAEYISMQKQSYANYAATRKKAEEAVHPNYAHAAQEAYPTLAYILNDYAERTVADLGRAVHVEAVRRRLLELPESLQILDFGCGVGRLMEALATSGFSVDGVDISAEMLGHAGRSPVLQHAGSRFFVSGGADCGAAPTNHYDLAYTLLCFQHICVRGVRQGILRALHECLKPEGVICVQVQFFAGITAADVPKEHANWQDDKTNVTDTNSRHDVWPTADMLPAMVADFSQLFADLRLQFVDLPNASFTANGQRGMVQHLFISGSKAAGLHRRIYHVAPSPSAPA